MIDGSRITVSFQGYHVLVALVLVLLACAFWVLQRPRSEDADLVERGFHGLIGLGLIALAGMLVVGWYLARWLA